MRRLTWRAATLVAARWETAAARTLVLDVPDWPGHLPGQHVDVRLTAPDGYQAQRSYSIASAWPAGGGSRLELTVQRLGDGEVSPYLTDVLGTGDQIELRGPVGGWFVWDRHVPGPVLLVAGGSGVVPLMAMVRARALLAAQQPFRLVYSLRSPEDLYFRRELEQVQRGGRGVEAHLVYTRSAPPGWPVPPGRLDAAALAEHGWPADAEPTCFVCGPTGFVETAANLLVELGHDPQRIRTERFGGS
ncbi:ferredoxin reductase [Kineococcus rhizosphaerae]|uniref:Ferredoxin-NADP reductase n=1 Tax=Kineococcus rhizosphaerae TaxID=559628 RepID=A0A2T0R674_9ACTN|nr:ferredoxin reductase [Kineococcus rhizosphaerae]PRY16663.1 ferredoxin-NADP reductase [Kineococcus rhizosphaerae]